MSSVRDSEVAKLLLKRHVISNDELTNHMPRNKRAYVQQNDRLVEALCSEDSAIDLSNKKSQQKDFRQTIPSASQSNPVIILPRPSDAAGQFVDRNITKSVLDGSSHDISQQNTIWGLQHQLIHTQNEQQSPSLRALLQKFDSSRERKSTQSVLYDYLHNSKSKPFQQSTISDVTMRRNSTSPKTEDMSISNETNAAHRGKVGVTAIKNQDTRPFSSIPPLAMIGDVVDKQFQIIPSLPANDSLNNLWVESKSDWELQSAQVHDRKAAYILENLRAGLREQQNKKQNLDTKKKGCSSDKSAYAVAPPVDKNYMQERSDASDVKRDHASVRERLQGVEDDKEPSSTDLYTQNVEQRPQKLINVAIQCELLRSNDNFTTNNALKNDVTTTTAGTVHGCVITEAQEGIHSEVPRDISDFTCLHCNICFNDAVLHSIHMGCHNLNEPFLCNICGMQCSDKYAFYTHIMRGHNAS